SAWLRCVVLFDETSGTDLGEAEFEFGNKRSFRFDASGQIRTVAMDHPKQVALRGRSLFSRLRDVVASIFRRVFGRKREPATGGTPMDPPRIAQPPSRFLRMIERIIPERFRQDILGDLYADIADRRAG